MAGDVISYSGDGTDPDDGALPASAFSWSIDFLHEGHVHPGTPITGVKSGSFTIPTSGHDFEGNTRYRISLTVTDSNGLKSTSFVTIYPRKVNLTFNTVPTGLTLYFDGIARTAPFTADTLVGFRHNVEARNQTSGGSSYTFASWSDGGAQQHDVVVPDRGSDLHRHVHGVFGPCPDHLQATELLDAADATRAPFPRRTPALRLRETPTSSRSAGARRRERSRRSPILPETPIRSQLR